MPGDEDPGEAAPAKVNLTLHVTGRRADGYHLLDSLVVFAGVGDRLRAAPAGTLTLAVEGPEAGALGAGGDNLVLRAARLLADGLAGEGRPRGAAIRLQKRLPVASGVGGGSADAAAALRLLARLWGVPLPAAGLAARLGADVPACLAGVPLRMAGAGEVLSPAPPLPAGLGLVLANPRVALSTAAVFGARVGDFGAPAMLPPGGWREAGALAATLRACRNDLEAPAVALCPSVADVLAAIAALPGCLLARMSGSGATCWGLFADPAKAERGAATLPAAWWRWGGGLHRGKGSGIAGPRSGPDPPGAVVASWTTAPPDRA